MRAFKLILFSTLAFSQMCLAGSALYKYTDNEGNTIISSSVPSEAANRGYTILSPRGNVIEVVKPKLTDDEIAAIEAKRLEAIEAEKAKEQERMQLEKQARKDTMLLKMFSSAQDIERSRDEKVENIKVQMGITQDNLVRLNDQLINAESVKSAHENQGSQVPKQVLDTIEQTKVQIEDNKLFLQRKEAEIELIRTQYQQMLERFKKVKPDTATYE